MKKDVFKPQAYLCLTNGGGIFIELNDTGKAVRYQWYNQKPSRWVKLYYNCNGDAYFKINGKRYHLNEFLCINL